MSDRKRILVLAEKPKKIFILAVKPNHLLALQFSR